MARIGFIGLGIMGSQMVLRLKERGFEVAVWNLEPERHALVEPAGALPQPSPAAVAEASEIVVLCVLDGAAGNRPSSFAQNPSDTAKPSAERPASAGAHDHPDDNRTSSLCALSCTR